MTEFMTWNWVFDPKLDQIEMDQWHMAETLAIWLDVRHWYGGMYLPKNDLLEMHFYPKPMEIDEVLLLWSELKPVVRHRIDEYLGNLGQIT